MLERLAQLRERLRGIAIDFGDDVDHAGLQREVKKLGGLEAHTNGRTLYEHLGGTRDVLCAWKQPLWMQLAGLFHSVYSTEAFKVQTVPYSARSRIQSLIGRKAERLVYLFAICRRVEIAELICSSEPVRREGVLTTNRLSGRKEKITREETLALGLLIMANLAEQACQADRSPSAWISEVSKLANGLRRNHCEIPNILENLSVSVIDESRLISDYKKSLNAVCIDPDAAEDFLARSETFFPTLGEIPFWRAYLALRRGDIEASKAYARVARTRFEAWGTPWDKRLSQAEWLDSCEGALRDADIPEVNAEYNYRVAAPFLALISPPDHRDTAVVPGGSRFEQYLRRFATDRGAGLLVYPIEQGPTFYDDSQFSIVSALETSFNEIQEEISALGCLQFHREAEQIGRCGDWDVCILYERGRKNTDNCAKCPVVTKIIESHDTMRTLAGLIYVSRLAPNSRVAAHRGPTNLRLRCHLGIEIPDGDCGIRVGSDYRRWVEGKCLVFDDFHDHEVWNVTSRRRTVLIVDIWNPGLSVDERQLITGLHQYAFRQAENLYRYWSKNDIARGKKPIGYD